MKKHFFLLALLTRSAFSMAQCVADESLQNPGVYPEILQEGTVGVSYESHINIVMYNDTIFANTTFTIDSIRIVSVNNLPDGISYSCETQNCTDYLNFASLYKYCINFYGDPVSENINDTLTIYVEKHYNMFSIPIISMDTIKVKLKVNDDLGIHQKKNEDYTISPNPVNDQFYISNVLQNEIESLTIFSSNGNIVSTYLNENIKANIAIPLNGPSGVYFVEIRLSSNEMIHQRLVKL